MTKRLGIIDFDTGMVTKFRLEGEEKAHLNDLTREIKSSEIIDTPVLPEETICYTQNGRIKIFFVQRPESLVPCQYKNRIYQLAWPIQVYGIIIDNLTPLEVCMFFAKQKVGHEYDELCHSPLPNQHNNGGRLCLGNALVRALSGTSAYTDVIQKVIHWIRTATFNDDLNDRIGQIPLELAAAVGMNESWHPKEIKDLFACWEKWTQEAGDNWRSVNTLGWIRARHFTEMRRSFRS